MSMNSSEGSRLPDKSSDRQRNYQTDRDRSPQQEQQRRRQHMGSLQRGLKFTSDEDIVRRRPAS